MEDRGDDLMRRARRVELVEALSSVRSNYSDSDFIKTLCDARNFYIGDDTTRQGIVTF
jgi:hypothetical protein